MSVNTKHSVGLLIVNDVSNSQSKEIVEEVKTHLYSMNMLLTVLHDKTADDIQKAVDKLTKLDSSSIEEIIIIVHTTRQPQMDDRKFECKGVIMDIHTDILNPLLCVKEFENKFKLIIVGGAEYKAALAPMDSKTSQLPYGSGKNVCILSSKNESKNARFITTVVSELIRKRGNIFDALNSENMNGLEYNWKTTQIISEIKIWKKQFPV